MSVQPFDAAADAGPQISFDPPDIWSCDSDQKKVYVEIYDAAEEEWVEIPTNSVETYAAKGEATAVQRSAKVQFPMDWGGASVLDFVKARVPGSEQNGLLHARISYERQNGRGEPVYTHFGWVGGVGPAGTALDGKMWIYDFGEILSGVPVTLTFNHPTFESAITEITRRTKSGGVPLEAATIKGPETEEEFAQIESVEQYQSSGFLGDTFSYVSPLNTQKTTTYGTESSTELLQAGDVSIRELQFGFDTTDQGTKSFKKNHDTLIEVYEWFSEQTNAELYFEPHESGEGLHLVIDVVPNRRRFGQVEVINNNTETYHEPVTVLENNALYETAPINTVRLRGEVGEGILDQAKDLLGDTISEITGSKPPSREFPVARAWSPALLQAAGGQEIAPPPINSNSTSQDEIRAEAKRELRKELSRVSEGHIEIAGMPTIKPFDRLDAYETCAGFVEEQPDAVIYEVEEVKHTKTWDDIYKTRIRVSIWAPDEDIEVETRMEEIDSTIEDE